MNELEVAKWMFEQFEQSDYLYQEQVVYRISKKFGTDFVYQNANGNLAISKEVLKYFRKLTEGMVVWEKSDKAWRILKNNETYNRRQIN